MVNWALSPLTPVRIYTCVAGFVGVFVIKCLLCKCGLGVFIRAPKVIYNVTEAAKFFVVFTWLQLFYQEIKYKMS